MFASRNQLQLENWDLFVLRHQNLANVRMHVISFLMFWLGPVLGLLVHPLYWLLFFSSGLVGTLGHFLFQDGKVDAKEATSSLQVVIFSSSMVLLFLRGRYAAEIARVQAKYARYQKGEIISIADPKLFHKLLAKESVHEFTT